MDESLSIISRSSLTANTYDAADRCGGVTNAGEC